MKRILILACGLGCAGCAYLKSGAMQRIDVHADAGDSVYVNRRLIGVGASSVNLLKGEGYFLRIKRAAGGQSSEWVSARLDARAWWDLIMWPTFFIDYSLGSHQRLKDGDHYAVSEAAPERFKPPEMMREETKQRSRLVRGLYVGAGCLFAGEALGEAAYAAQGATRVALNAASFTCLGGVVYGIYTTVSSTSRIGRINKRFEFSTPEK